MQPVFRALRETNIILTEAEQSIFSLLREYVAERSLAVEMRVAGGWVRDKLLGLESHDVDVALDRMTGEQFAVGLHAWLHAHQVRCSGLGVIQSNPDRSKHLETATLHFNGHSIDFVNLRSEEYAQGSRIPSAVQFGTPGEDAARRDCTINALFLNLSTEQVEDWTGLGLTDLEGRLIRTPLAPRETLLDDPLRLLRAIRFAARFAFSLHPALLAAIQEAEIHAAFSQKVSRERVGVEINKIVSHLRGWEGLQLLHAGHCLPLVYAPMVECDQELPTQAHYDQLLVLFERVVLPFLPREATAPQRRLALLCLGLLPFAGSRTRPPSGKGESAVASLIRDSLKLPNRDILDGLDVLSHLQRFDPDLLTNPTQIGPLVKAVKQHWPLALRFACLQRLYHDPSLPVEETSLAYSQLETRIQALHLGDCWQWNSLIDGRRLQEMFNLQGGGPRIGWLLDRLLLWRYANPLADRSMAEAWVLQEREALIAEMNSEVLSEASTRSPSTPQPAQKRAKK